MPPDPTAAGGRRWTGDSVVLAVACVAQFMVVLDVSIVNVALPAMQRDLGMSANGLQWVLNAYTLTFAGFLLLGGRAADLYGRRRLFLVGLVVFTGMSLLGGFAQTGGQLIAARAGQGLGGAILSPATLTILTTTFTQPKARARALGLWSAVAGAGGATGVLAGGVLTDLLSWRWILFINVPIGIVTAVVARLAVRESRADGPRIRLDYAGAVLVTAGLSTVVYAVVSTDSHAWGSAATLLPLAAGLVMLAAFLVLETRHSAPLMPLRLFRSRSVTGANLIMMLVGTAMFSVFFFLSQYLQDVHGYSPLRTGFAFLPMPLAIILGTQVSSRLVGRLGPRLLLIVGPGLAATGMAWLALLHASSGYLLGVGLPGTLLTFGFGVGFVPVTLAATTGVARADAGLASGLINTTRQVGGSVGLAALVAVATARQHALLGRAAGVAQSDGYARAFLVTAVLLLGAAVVAAVVLPRRPAPAPHDPVTDVARQGVPVLEVA